MKTDVANRMVTSVASQSTPDAPAAPQQQAHAHPVVDAWWDNTFQSIPALREAGVYGPLVQQLDVLKQTLNQSK